jgi:hypothetical protein
VGTDRHAPREEVPVLRPARAAISWNQVLLDVGIIADEADRQLEETVGGYMAAQAAA